MGPLQWGRDLSVAEGVPLTGWSDATSAASMGPRPFGRGRKKELSLDEQILYASMGPRPFGRGRSDMFSVDIGRTSELQWGRDLSVAEGARSDQYLRGLPEASMGPRPFGRGRSKTIMSAPLARRLLQWGRDLSVAEGSRRCKPPAGTISLQWGRDLSVAEGSWPPGLTRRFAKASMGPRPFGRGRVT